MRKGPRQIEIPDDPTHEQRQDIIQRGMNSALWSLQSARKTEHQIEDLMRRKGLTDDYIGIIIHRLTELHLLDDVSYAEDYVASRSAYQGRRRVTQDLMRKGVKKDIIDRAFEDTNPDDEREVALELARRKVVNMTISDRNKITQRLVGFLARRGFNPSQAYSVIKEVLDEVENDAYDDDL